MYFYADARQGGVADVLDSASEFVGGGIVGQDEAGAGAEAVVGLGFGELVGGFFAVFALGGGG